MSKDLPERLRKATGLDLDLKQEAAGEIEKLQHRLRLQDAAIRSGDVATLTDEERVVLGNVANDAARSFMPHTERVVRGLLERLSPPTT